MWADVNKCLSLTRSLNSEVDLVPIAVVYVYNNVVII